MTLPKSNFSNLPAHVLNFSDVQHAATSGNELDCHVDHMKLRTSLHTVMRTITVRELKVLRLFYGLEGRGQHSFGEIAELLKLDLKRVVQIRDKALRKLQHPSRTQRLAHFIQN